jgi:hypothetical protein
MAAKLMRDFFGTRGDAEVKSGASVDGQTKAVTTNLTSCVRREAKEASACESSERILRTIDAC